MLINVLCQALDPFGNDEISAITTFMRLVTSSNFNGLCSKILTFALNIIPPQILLNDERKQDQ